MDDALKAVEQARDAATVAIDDGLRALSSTLASGSATVEQEAGKLRESAQVGRD